MARPIGIDGLLKQLLNTTRTGPTVRVNNEASPCVQSKQMIRSVRDEAFEHRTSGRTHYFVNFVLKIDIFGIVESIRVLQ